MTDQKICASCEHLGRGGDAFVCARMAQMDGEVSSGTKAFAQALEGRSARVVVAPDFGCVMWKKATVLKDATEFPQ